MEHLKRLLFLLFCVLIFHPLLTKAEAAGNGSCPCDCEYMDKIDYWNNKSDEYANKTLVEIYQALLPQLEATKKALQEDKTQLSSYQATKTSAVDTRPSASQVGGTVGIVFVCMFVGLVLAFDLSSYKQHLKTIQYCRKRF